MQTHANKEGGGVSKRGLILMDLVSSHKSNWPDFPSPWALWLVAAYRGPLAHPSLCLWFPALLLRSPACLWEAGAAASSWGQTL